MFIAHLPAGYILTTKIKEYFNLKTTGLLATGLIGSIFPDFDLIYFFLVDRGAHPHHSYWIHIPYYWLLITLASLSSLWILKKKKSFVFASIFLGNVFLHLILDTFVSRVKWYVPFSYKSYSFLEIPAKYGFWVENFLYHWSILVELAIVLYALYIFIKYQKNRVKT